MRVEKTVKAVIFDIDDTLFDSATLAKMARINAVKAMVESGLPLKSIARGYKLLMRIVEKYGSNYNQHFDKVLEELGCEWNPKIIAAGVVAYHDTKQAYLKPEPEVIPTLITLRDRGYKLGIVSNGKAVKQWEKLIRLGLHHFFHAVVISEEVGSEKPDVEIFRITLKKLEVKPQEAIYVGDHLETDILGANKVGMISVRIVREKRKKQSYKDKITPRFSIKRISDLLKFL